MLILATPETKQRLRECFRINRRLVTNRRYELWSWLRYLRDYAQGEGKLYQKGHVRCKLYPDWADHSFGVVVETLENGEWKHWFTGGLIFQGPTQPLNGSAPAFTVSMESYVGWSLHT